MICCGCIYIFPSFKLSLKLKEFELLLIDISNLMSSPVFTMGDTNFDFCCKRKCLKIIRTFLQYKGMTQLLGTAIRFTTDSATPIDHICHIQLLDNPECGTLDAGLIDHCVTLVELPFLCKIEMILKLWIKNLLSGVKEMQKTSFGFTFRWHGNTLMTNLNCF